MCPPPFSKEKKKNYDFPEKKSGLSQHQATVLSPYSPLPQPSLIFSGHRDTDLPEDEDEHHQQDDAARHRHQNDPPLQLLLHSHLGLRNCVRCCLG